MKILYVDTLIKLLARMIYVFVNVFSDLIAKKNGFLGQSKKKNVSRKSVYILCDLKSFAGKRYKRKRAVYSE